MTAPAPRVHKVGKFRIVSSRQAYKDGDWPRIEWGVFDNDDVGELQFCAARLKDARQWAKEHSRGRPREEERM